LSSGICNVEPRDWLIAVSQLRGVGRKALQILFPYLRSISPAKDSLISSLPTDLPLPIRLKKIIEQTSLPYVQRVKRELSERKIHCITCLDEIFPHSLLEIPDPPFLLYAIGNVHLLSLPKIAIVGTRIPTVYGRRVSFQMAADLNQLGFVVVSGMAKGIDGEAHRGSIAVGGRTIAVLGSGIDVVYPTGHQSLYSKIQEKGLIISEYPPGTLPHKVYFPERNRIISGLSHGIVVIEAALRSGSGITVDCALEQGRDVFAVPGSIFSTQSEGPRRLIKQGAKLIHSVQDIVEEYSWIRTISDPAENFDSCKEIEVNTRQLLDIIENKQVTVEQLNCLTGIPVPEIINTLVLLEIQGKVKKLSGSVYAKGKD
jgi:DNA processing protein